MATFPTSLKDEPLISADNLNGYFHHKDATLLDFNSLTFPSKNCSIPFFDLVEPDLGKTRLGQDADENTGIIGHKEKFKNLGGIETEVRVFASGDSDLKDVIQVGFFSTALTFNTLVGAFSVSETISGNDSGASAQIVSITSTTLFLTNIVGNFEVGETITGLISGATANVVVTPKYFFHQITENTNPLERGVHEYYFDEWFDTNLQPDESKNLPRLVWVNGYEKSNGKGEVYSWTGGIAVVTSFIANTSITTNRTWRSLGFTEDANGDAYVIINGVEYQLDDPTDLDTNTIDVATTAGITVGDYAFSKIEVDEVPIPFDMCRQNKGYMFYGNWNTRDLYQSNAFNRPSTTSIVASNAVQNDMSIAETSEYTGSGSNVYKITITDIFPAIQTDSQEFFGSGANTSFWQTSGYNSGDEDQHIYTMVIISDLVVTCSGGIVPAYTEGEIIVGNTSGAFLRVVDLSGAGAFAVERISGDPVIGETFTGQSTGVTSPAVVGLLYSNYAFLYKDSVQVTGLTGMLPSGALQFAIPGNQFTSPYDGLQFVTSQVGQNNVGDYFQLTIQDKPSQPDEFKWQKNNGALSSADPITGSAQSIEDGLEIIFQQEEGHVVGDFWEIQVDQAIDRAWVNFYYTVPIRKPGEGYKYRLPSNFWTMDTQEESMYVNSSYGEWGYVSTILSGDLQSEDVSYTPLKQVGASKVLYPYLTGHLNDDLVFVTVDKKLNTIGRKQFLEKPQTGYLSDPVLKDFQALSFKLGRIKYLNKKVYITSPLDSVTMCYDTFKEYWQPPKTFPEMGILSIVNNDLVAHSHVRNQSFTAFTSTSGDDGQPYEVIMQTATTSMGLRWQQKTSNMTFIEGYMQGNPKLEISVLYGTNGCGGIKKHTVKPIICLSSGDAPLGQGSLGSHPLGNDPVPLTDYFKEIYKMQSSSYYFASLRASCTAKSHTYKILSLGLNGIIAPNMNNNLVNAENKNIIN